MFQDSSIASTSSTTRPFERVPPPFHSRPSDLGDSETQVPIASDRWDERSLVINTAKDDQRITQQCNSLPTPITPTPTTDPNPVKPEKTRNGIHNETIQESTLTAQELEVFQFLHEKFLLNQQQQLEHEHQHQQQLETEEEVKTMSKSEERPNHQSLDEHQQLGKIDVDDSPTKDTLRKKSSIVSNLSVTSSALSSSSSLLLSPLSSVSSPIKDASVSSPTATIAMAPATAPSRGSGSYARTRRASTYGLGNKYKCTICPKEFERPSTLKTHMNSHTGNRPYECTREGCSWKFTVLSNLKRHERSCGNSEYARRPSFGVSMPTAAVVAVAVDKTSDLPCVAQGEDLVVDRGTLADI
ncbi:hypothetical protein BDR26DRAFT_852712 [Obelidium mucronatum]|nr:hypothetical protein BDR26DRAFT_852712 [Obelidium mucronatum]